MESRSRIARIYFVAGAVVLLAGVLVWRRGAGQLSQTATLPDGTVLRLEAVSYGKEHSFFVGERWEQVWAVLTRFMPAPDRCK